MNGNILVTLGAIYCVPHLEQIKISYWGESDSFFRSLWAAWWQMRDSRMWNGSTRVRGRGVACSVRVVVREGYSVWCEGRGGWWLSAIWRAYWQYRRESRSQFWKGAK